MWIATITPTKIGSVEGISIPKMMVESPVMRSVVLCPRGRFTTERSQTEMTERRHFTIGQVRLRGRIFRGSTSLAEL